MANLSEKEVLRVSLVVLRKVFKEWANVERRQSGLFKNPDGHTVRIGKKYESDIGGWILKGPYIAKPISIEVKRSNFRPNRIYKADKVRFLNQCNYLQEINSQGGVGFWINHPSHLYKILPPVLMHGARVTLDNNLYVILTGTGAPVIK